ncbi:cytochrome P450 [Actinomadura sp. LOL_016]|uniref:cytochrome P450 n=1 Tax=unclassified Actinomadura TaxID=2626254 RepID=UPI003A804C33
MVQGRPRATIGYDDIDFSDLDFWARPLDEREAAFALLRERPRAPFFAESESEDFGLGVGPGYYVLTRHADVLEASRHPDVFSSAGGVRIGERPPESLAVFDSMIGMDDPRHARLRRIVSRAFTPRMIERFAGDVAQAAADVVDAVAERGSCDFVAELAAPLPLRIICDLMGIDAKDRAFVFDRTNAILGAEDPEYTAPHDDPFTATLRAATELGDLVEDLARVRAERPTGDLTTALINANPDGERLTRQEIASFFVLLVIAGNETTRNAISHGLVLLTGHPEQRARWASDFDGYARTAVEEIVRVASPVVYMRRTVTRDHETAGGQRFAAGDKVLLCYWSANRDESVFDAPHRFDIARDPNPHIGFGAAGPHFCLGAHLARREITVMFRELFRRVPDIRASGEPERLRSSFINGIKRLPCEFTPVR